MARERWGFFWKNIDGLGKFNRVVLGVTLVVAASLSRNNKIKSALMGLIGLDLIMSGFLHWCFLRALLRRPTRRARKQRAALAES